MPRITLNVSGSDRITNGPAILNSQWIRNIRILRANCTFQNDINIVDTHQIVLGLVSRIGDNPNIDIYCSTLQRRDGDTQSHSESGPVKTYCDIGDVFRYGMDPSSLLSQKQQASGPVDILLYFMYSENYNPVDVTAMFSYLEIELEYSYVDPEQLFLCAAEDVFELSAIMRANTNFVIVELDVEKYWHVHVPEIMNTNNAVFKSAQAVIVKRFFYPHEFPLWNDPDFRIRTISRRDDSILCCPTKYITSDLCAKAVHQTPSLLRHIPPDLQTLDVCRSAYSADPSSVQYIHRDVQHKFIISALDTK
jgi:hypothetical protein